MEHRVAGTKRQCHLMTHSAIYRRLSSLERGTEWAVTMTPHSPGAGTCLREDGLRWVLTLHWTRQQANPVPVFQETGKALQVSLTGLPSGTGRQRAISALAGI